MPLVFVLGCSHFVGRSLPPADAGPNRDIDARLEGAWRDEDGGRTCAYSNGLGTVVITGVSNIYRIIDVEKAGKWLASQTNFAPYPTPVISGDSVDGIRAITNTFKYRILRRGENYVDISYPERPLRNVMKSIPPNGDTNDVVSTYISTIREVGLVSSDTRIHFSADDNSCWVGEDPASRARYFKVDSPTAAQTESTAPGPK